MKLVGPGSYTVELSPSFAYERVKQVERAHHRSRAGALHTYLTPGGFTRFKLPLTWVGSADRDTVTSWWKTGADLSYTEETAEPFSYHSVRVVGVEEPFQSFVEPYYQTYYAGEVILETI